MEGLTISANICQLYQYTIFPSYPLTSKAFHFSLG